MNGLPGLDLDHLKTFVEVAKEGNFSRAAAKVFRSQPAVSAQIRQLEDDYQQRLFDRSGKAVRLTPKKLFGWDGVWLDNDNVLFLSRAASEKNDSIYRMSTDGKNLKRLIRNARFPSVSTL